MARRINKRRELDSLEETTKSENIVEKEPINVNLNMGIPEVDSEGNIIHEMSTPVDESAELSSIELSSAPEEDEEEKIVATITEEDVKDLDEKFGIDAEEEIEKIFTEKEVEVKILPKQPRSVAGLSRSQLRIFERTGRLPN